MRSCLPARRSGGPGGSGCETTGDRPAVRRSQYDKCPERDQGQFTKDTGVAVQTSYAASSTLAQQIVHGAEADLFLSADTKWADYLAEKGQVVRQQDLLGNRLVIVVPADSKIEVKRPDDLLAAGIEHLALGEPQSVPAGIYARQALTKLGLWDQLKAKVVSADDVRDALAYVETGSAEAGDRLRDRCRDQQESQGGRRDSREADRARPLSARALEARRRQ